MQLPTSVWVTQTCTSLPLQLSVKHFPGAHEIDRRRLNLPFCWGSRQLDLLFKCSTVHQQEDEKNKIDFYTSLGQND